MNARGHILAILILSVLCGCNDHQKEQSEDSSPSARKVKFSAEIPDYYSDGCNGEVSNYPVPFEKAPKETPFLFLPENAVNLAKGKRVKCREGLTIIQGSLEMITNGDKQATEGHFVEFDFDNFTTPWVQVDLGSVCEIHGIWVWHYYGTGTIGEKLYEDVVVRISSDEDFGEEVTTVFNNDFDGSSGFGIGKDKPYWETRFGKAISVDGVKGRYVRVSGTGDCKYHRFGMIELEVYGHLSIKKNNAGEQGMAHQPESDF